MTPDIIKFIKVLVETKGTHPFTRVFIDSNRFSRFNLFCSWSFSCDSNDSSMDQFSSMKSIRGLSSQHRKHLIISRSDIRKSRVFKPRTQFCSNIIESNNFVAISLFLKFFSKSIQIQVLESIGVFQDFFKGSCRINVRLIVILKGIDGHFSSPFIGFRMDSSTV